MAKRNPTRTANQQASGTKQQQRAVKAAHAANAATLAATVAPPAPTVQPAAPTPTPAPVAPPAPPLVPTGHAPVPASGVLATAAATQPAATPTAPASGPAVTPNMLKTLAYLAQGPQTRAQVQAYCGTTITGYPRLAALGYVTQVRGGGKTGQALVFTITAAGLAYLASLPTSPNTSAPAQAPGTITAAPTTPAAPGSNPV